VNAFWTIAGEHEQDGDAGPIAVPNLPQLETLEGYYAGRRSQAGKQHPR
jgi:hypothetical protein